MILTVTLNPCIDRTLTVSNFREGGTTPVSATRTEIGGKGLNVSRALLPRKRRFRHQIYP